MISLNLKKSNDFKEPILFIKEIINKNVQRLSEMMDLIFEPL
jgi:hypothetical protein